MEEEVLGKAYDGRLMRRLLGYMRPYRWSVVFALCLVAIVTPLELAPPFIFKSAIDKYFTPFVNNAITESADHARIGTRRVGSLDDQRSRRFENVLTGSADAMKQAAFTLAV